MLILCLSVFSHKEQEKQEMIQVLDNGVLSNENLVDYATVQSDECPDRTACRGRPSSAGLRR